MVHAERTPQSHEVQKIVDERKAQIAEFRAAMEGHSMDEELSRIFTKVEESEPDPEAPEIDVSVFGVNAEIVAKIWQGYRAWSNRVYIADVLNNDNRRQWRLAFQEHYGPEAGRRLLSILEKNKYKLAPVSGLTNTWLENLCIQLERGDAHDRSLARKIDEVWSVSGQNNIFNEYLTLEDNEEKKKIMAQFGRDFSKVLQVIAEDAERRAVRAA